METYWGIDIYGEHIDAEDIEVEGGDGGEDTDLDGGDGDIDLDDEENDLDDIALHWHIWQKHPLWCVGEPNIKSYPIQ